MIYRLVFKNTGDEIPFLPVNQDLLDFYIHSLDQQNLNSFGPLNPRLGQTIESRIHELRECILDINSWITDLAGIKFDVCDDDTQYLDQKLLNRMHAVWVKSQSQIYDIQQKRQELNFSELAEKVHNSFPDDIQKPPLSAVLHNLGLTHRFGLLNVPHIHVLELMFNDIKYSVSDSWTKVADNHFDKKLLTNDQANLRMTFNHLGRTLYNKFVFFDTDLECDDENSFNELLGNVTLNLHPPQTVPLSKEYVEWCQRHGREPLGDNLNLGNIPNLYDDLTKYRTIVFRNLLANNKFSIRKG